jgi:hypothetical protein
VGAINVHKKDVLENGAFFFCEWQGAGEAQQAIFVIVFSLKNNAFFDVLLASFAAPWMVMGAINLSFVLLAYFLKR